MAFERLPQLRRPEETKVSARVLDVFYRPQTKPVDQTLSLLSESLERFNPNLQKYIQKKEEVTEKVDTAKAQADYNKNRKDFKTLIEKGEIPEGASPYYVNAYINAELREKARQFNDELYAEYQNSNVKNSLDSGTLGQDLIDHYSPFFGSILGPGDQLYESLNTLLDGDFRNFLTQFPINDNRLDLSEATVQQISELRALGESAFALRDSIRNLIDSDNLTYFAALDYLAKSTLGFSVLSMLEDPCFSQKLLGQIAKPDLKGLLNI